MTDATRRHEILNKAAIVAGFAAYLEAELEHLGPEELRGHIDRIGRASRELMALYAEARNESARDDDDPAPGATPPRRTGPVSPVASRPWATTSGGPHRLLL